MDGFGVTINLHDLKRQVALPTIQMRLTLDEMHPKNMYEKRSGFELWASEFRNNEAERLGGPAEGRQIEDITLKEALYSQTNGHNRKHKADDGARGCARSVCPDLRGHRREQRDKSALIAATVSRITDKTGLNSAAKTGLTRAQVGADLFCACVARKKRNIQHELVHQLLVNGTKTEKEHDFYIDPEALEDDTFFKFVPAGIDIPAKVKEELKNKPDTLKLVTSMHSMITQLNHEPPQQVFEEFKTQTRAIQRVQLPANHRYSKDNDNDGQGNDSSSKVTPEQTPVATTQSETQPKKTASL
jgi:hypothetical protein